MTPTNAALDNLVLVLGEAVRLAEDLRGKRPAERTPADLAAIARVLRPAVRGLDQLAAADPAAGPVPEKKHRRVRK